MVLVLLGLLTLVVHTTIILHDIFPSSVNMMLCSGLLASGLARRGCGCSCPGHLGWVAASSAFR